MNTPQNEFLGCSAAVRISNQEEFEKLKEWMSINNLFLMNKEHVSKMNYPGNGVTIGIGREVNTMLVFWAPIIDIENYKFYSINEFFKADQQEKVVEANAVITNETVEVTKEMLALEVLEKPAGSMIESNIDNIIKLIPAIESKKNVIVTKDNYKDFTKKGDGLVPNYRKQAKEMEVELSAIKNRYIEPFNVFADKVNQVINALNSTADEVAKNCNTFELERKEALRKERQDEIDKLKTYLIGKELISKEYADKFVFDEKWLNVSCSKKKFQEEVEKQFNELIEKLKIDKQNVEMVEKTIVNQCQLTGLDHATIDRDKYKHMLANGENLGVIVTTITNDIETIKKNRDIAVARQKEQQARELEKQNQLAEQEKQRALAEQQKRFEAQQKAREEKEKQTQSTQSMTYVDTKGNLHEIKVNDKVVGYESEEDIRVLKQPTVGDPNIKYHYVYEFEGDSGAIATLAKILNAVANVFKTFKFKRVSFEVIKPSEDLENVTGGN